MADKYPRAKMRVQASATLKGTKMPVIKRSQVKQLYCYTVQQQNSDGSWFDRLSCNDWNEAVTYGESFVTGTLRIVDNSEAM